MRFKLAFVLQRASKLPCRMRCGTQLVRQTVWCCPHPAPRCAVGRIMLVGLLMAGTHPLAVPMAAGACWLLLCGQLYIIP